MFAIVDAKDYIWLSRYKWYVVKQGGIYYAVRKQNRRDIRMHRAIMAPPEGMVVDVRKALDRIAGRAGWEPGDIRTKMFRHTYCAARLQTLDRGAPVSEYTVSRELGHGGPSLVRRVYGHLGQVRHRAEVVEYCAKDLEAQLGEPGLIRPMPTA